MGQHRAAVIGLGIMGRRMLANLQSHPKFEIAGMWDPSEASAHAAREAHPETPVMTSPGALIDAKVADVVYIACPPEWHK